MNQEKLIGWLTALIKNVLVQEKAGGKLVTIVFMTAAKMKALNRRYRQQNKATDVLAFTAATTRALDKNYLGEIVICLPYVWQQAKRYGVAKEEELARMVVHGTLHLLGYSHYTATAARRMLPRQERYLTQFKKIIVANYAHVS